MAFKFDMDSFKLKSRQMGDAQTAVGRVLPMMPWLASTVFFAALIAGAGTLYMTGRVMTHAKQVHVQEAPTYQVKRQPLSPQEYQDQVQWLLRLHPDVKFALPKKGGLQVSIEKGDYHAEWLYALSALQSHGGDIVWDVSELCVGRCEGAAATATVSGYRQKLVDNAN